MIAMQSEQGREISFLIKRLRGRLDPSTEMLGDHQRLLSRRGKTVSQEEVAEAIGVSRGWFACLESGSKRPSVRIIARLATALNTSADERADLLELGIPALQSCLTVNARCPNCMSLAR
jgi:DNA-binding XRE family transcriptional regulator